MTLSTGKSSVMAAAGMFFCLVAAVVQSRHAGIRPEVAQFYWGFMATWALGHAVVLLFLQARGGRSNAFNGAYFALSFLALLGLGRGTPLREAAALAVFLSAVFLTGLPVVRVLFDDDRSPLLISLPVGFALLIGVGSWLGVAGLFRRSLLAGLLAAGSLYGALSSWRWITGRATRIPPFLRNKTSVSSLLSVEWVFLLFCFLVVASSAPETTCDASRRYWPYIRLWLVHGGFFNNPHNWPFVVPQSGVVYGALFASLVGNAVRLAMPLAWLSLIGVVVGWRQKAPFALSVSFAAILAGAPLLLWCSKCLMVDALGILLVMVVSVAVLSGNFSRPILLAGAVGMLGGVAWACKTSSVGYIGSLLLVTLLKIWRNRHGFPSFLVAAISLSAGALVATGPWLLHAFRQSGNPFFPFLSWIFPSPLWPHGLGLTSLGDFAFKSFADWLFWPWQVTFHADRFVEGLPGFLGMSVPVLGILFLLHRAEDRSQSWWILMITAAVGTLSLWRYTAYLRYWMPGLWLVYLALQPGMARWSQLSLHKNVFAATVGAFIFIQVPSTMSALWKDPQGWPWDYYRGKISEDGYLERSYPGLGGIRQGLKGAGWEDIVLITGFEGAGYLLPCLPVVIHSRGMQLHAQDPEGQIAYLHTMGPSYWVMNRESDDAKFFARIGVGSRFLTPDRLVGQSGPYDIYRLKKDPS